MAFELPAPLNLQGSVDVSDVTLTWDAYLGAAKAGHQVAGFKIFRSQSVSERGPLLVDINVLGPAAVQHIDLNVTLEGTVFYTLVAVEPDDYGSRPYGEGGNVPYGV